MNDEQMVHYFRERTEKAEAELERLRALLGDGPDAQEREIVRLRDNVRGLTKACNDLEARADHNAAVAKEWKDRAGKVPGVCSCACDHAGLCKLHWQERDQLRAEVERLTSTIRTMSEVSNHNARECIEATRDLAQGRAAYEAQKDRAEKAESRLADYDTRLTAVMSPDLKCWHQNSRDEWPEVAAWVITNLRERIEDAEKALVLIGDKVVVDFDDATVGQVDSVVKNREKYVDWLRKVELSAVRHAEAVKLLREAQEWIYCAYRFEQANALRSKIKAHLAACDGKGVGV